MYWLITSIRNFLFDKGVFKSKSHNNVFILCVGNLRVGGTGKTPLTEYLIENLRKEFKVAVVSLGYKRKSKGLVEIRPEDDFSITGDEPKQMSEKFPDVPFVVNKDRNEAIEYLKNKYPDLQAIILDDAMQYRKTKADVNILLTEYARPFFKDFCLPYGRLRERRKEKKRANYIIVSKCPENLSEKDQNGFIKKINPNKEQQVFFSCIRYDNKLKEELKDKKIVLITGIDNPKPLKEYIESFCEIHQMMKFPDHYSFSHEEKERFASLSLPIVTTEKDFSRLRDLKDKIYVQKISAEVNGNFIGLLKKDIENKLRHNNQKN